MAGPVFEPKLGLDSIDLSGWERLKASLLSTIANGGHIKVGVLTDEVAEKPTEVTVSGAASNAKDEEEITLVDLCFVHEFGSEDGHIPERSFMRSTLIAKRPELVRLCGDLTKKIVNSEGRYKLETALGVLGEFVVAAIKTTIRDRETTGPENQANAPETIARKGTDLPLVDHGQLINAISYEVFINDELGQSE